MENTFEQQVEKELKSMDQRLYDLEEKIVSIDSKLTQVVNAIVGNPLTKTGGFVNEIDVLKKKMHDIEAKVEAHEEFKKKVYWIIGAIGGLLLLGQYITNIYSNVKS